MIIKNHTIELNDTSASEMARFRQIMLKIWRQQIEDDKNAEIVIDSFKSSQIDTSTYFVPVFEVIECIKKKIGVIYPNMSFSQFVNGPIRSTPDKLGVIIYDDSQGNSKNGAVELEWNYFNGINLIAKTFKTTIQFGKYHTEFTLVIFDHKLEKIAFKFTVYDFDVFLSLCNLIGIPIIIHEKKLYDLYRKKINEANNDPNKLDVIYESLPKALFGKMGDDDELYDHLNLILNDTSLLEGIGTPSKFDTNEDKAILQILYAITDRLVLYKKLRDTDLLYKVYSKLNGEEVQDLLRFLTRLVAEFDTSKPTETVYFDNSYYLFRDTHIKTFWSGEEILIDNCRKTDKTKTIGKAKTSISAKELDRINPPGVYEAPIFEHYIEWKSFNPLAKLNFGTKLGDLGEQVGDENTFVIALKLHDMATKQSNWDLFNIATDLLSLLSAYGALRIVLAKGAPISARLLATVVLAKDTAHYAMLSNGTLEKWHKNGYGWLAHLWVAFSVTVDLASFGLPNLSKIAKEGNAAAELAETAEDAREIRRVTAQAQQIINEYQKLETALAKIAKKSEDNFGNINYVKNIEDEIRILDKEYGMFFDKDGKALFKNKLGGTFEASLKIELTQVIKARSQALKNGGKASDLIFTHNHFGNSALSPSDILLSIKYNLKEIRAVGSSGIDYSLKRINNYPLENSQTYINIMKKVNSKMLSKYPKVHPINYIDGGNNIEVAQFYAETLLEQFGDYIEYTKFTK
ncbi:hypothetical protein [Flavobacterium sp.]|uniref:hypothetical protein n=1 Tax=Flavobacterium sp. TaxID=239 RepID=UPI0031CEBC7A